MKRLLSSAIVRYCARLHTSGAPRAAVCSANMLSAHDLWSVARRAGAAVAAPAAHTHMTIPRLCASSGGVCVSVRGAGRRRAIPPPLVVVAAQKHPSNSTWHNPCND